MANFFPPSVTGNDREVELNKSIKASFLFDYFDLDGNPMEKVRFFDSNGANDSGFFTYRGVQQNAGQWFEVDVADLDKVRYHAGLVVGNEVVNVLGYDGEFWSTPATSRVFSIKPNTRPPRTTAFASTVLSNENIMARDMFEATDFDGDEITRYRLRDQKSNGNSGAFYLNNVKQQQGRWFEFSAEELAKVRYYGGRNGQAERFFVQAYDGKWGPVDFEWVRTTPNRYAPTVSAVDRKLKTNSVVNVGNLFSWNDRDGNTLKKYSFFDTGILPDGGFFSVNGVRQVAREWFTVNARDVERGFVKYHSAQVVDSERLRVKVFDGKKSSKVKTFRVDTVVTPDVDTPDLVQVVDDSTIVDIRDWTIQTDTGPVIEKWQFFDATTELDPFGNEFTGSLTYRGNVLPPQRVREFTEAQLDDVSFISGVIDRGIEHDEIYVRGYNGAEWSEWNRVNVTTVFNVIPSMEKPPLKWGPATFGSGTTLTYSFMEALPLYYLGADEDNNSFMTFTPKMRQATREILKEVFTNQFDINFVEVSDTIGGTMRFGMIDVSDAIAYAYLPPTFGSNPNDNFSPFGDIFAEHDFEYESTDVNGNDITMGWFDDWALEKGSDLYLALIHEVGHAIGLAHPFGETNPGEEVLRLPVNNHEYTVMSYARYDNIPDPAFPLTDGPATTQLYDNYVISHLYGHDDEYNREDTVYRWNPNEHELYAQTIHDPGGIDTINVSNYTPGSVIDLREGHHSSLAGEVNNFNITYGTIIENVIAGPGNDTITGNEADNRIIGGRGNDIIATKGGRDVAFGNQGRDTYIYELGNGRLTINEDKGGGIDAVEFHAFDEDFDEFRQDFAFRSDGKDLTVSLAINGEQSEGSVTIKNMHWGGSKVEVLRMYDNQGEQIGPDVSLNSIFLQATNNLQRFRLTEFRDAFGVLAIPS